MPFEQNRYLRDRIMLAGVADAQDLTHWEVLGLAPEDDSADLEEASDQFDADWQELEETQPARGALKKAAMTVRDRAILALSERRAPAKTPESLASWAPTIVALVPQAEPEPAPVDLPPSPAPPAAVVAKAPVHVEPVPQVPPKPPSVQPQVAISDAESAPTRRHVEANSERKAERPAPQTVVAAHANERTKPNVAAFLLAAALVAVVGIGFVKFGGKPAEPRAENSAAAPQAAATPAASTGSPAPGAQPASNAEPAKANAAELAPAPAAPSASTQEQPASAKIKSAPLVAGHSSFVPGQPGDIPTPPVGGEFAAASLADLPTARSASWPSNDVALAQLAELTDVRGKMAAAKTWTLDALANKQPTELVQILGTNFQHMPSDERSYMQIWAQVAEDSPATGHVAWFSEGKFLGVVVRESAAADMSGRLQAEFGRGPDIEDPVQTESGRVTRRIWLQGNDVYSLRFGKPNETLLVARRSVYTRWRMLERQVENADHLFAEADKAANEIPPKLDEAEAGFKKCLELVPYYTRATGRLGKLAYWRGKYDEATRILEEGLGIVRHRDIRGDMLYYRGVVHTWFGEIDAAKALFREDEQLNKQAIQGPARLAALEGRWDKAVLKLALQEIHCAPATLLPDRPAQVAKEFPLAQDELETRLHALISAKEFAGHERFVEKRCSGHH